MPNRTPIIFFIIWRKLRNSSWLWNEGFLPQKILPMSGRAGVLQWKEWIVKEILEYWLVPFFFSPKNDRRDTPTTSAPSRNDDYGVEFKGQWDWGWVRAVLGLGWIFSSSAFDLETTLDPKGPKPSSLSSVSWKKLLLFIVCLGFSLAI